MREKRSVSEPRWRTSSAGEVIVARWWRGEYGWKGELLKAVLLPAELLYRIAIWLRNAAYDAGFVGAATAPLPIVSVGNLTVGGTGKTPVAAWLVDELRRRGHRPALLHGGYASDEPSLHRQWHPDVPVFADRDRVESARRALQCDATVAVLDDGFQYRRLEKDLEVLLIAAETWTRRPRLLPSGPWREHPSAAVRRGDLLIVTRKTGTPALAQNVALDLAEISAAAPIVCVYLKPAGFRRVGGGAGMPPGNVLAVAGVAQPTLFAENVRYAGADVTEVLVFPDHHEYTPADASRIHDMASGRSVVMTAKDHVKLGALLTDTDIWILEQRVEIESGHDVLAATLDRIRP